MQDHQVYPVLITSILQDFRWMFLNRKMLPEGWLAEAIPAFRLNEAGFKKDLERIEKSGVKISYNSQINELRFNEIRRITISFIFQRVHGHHEDLQSKELIP